MNNVKHDDIIDCSGMNCPLPVIKTKMKIDAMEPGQILKVTTTDPGSCKDMPAWASRVGHELLATEEGDGEYFFLVKKGD